ncbi:MAG: Panacea domain-containing protein [Roseburia faecis]|uniref:Panacea domain-containing protein n=1 Tax=Roseburia faecis TaxID=301302 RepID=UPI001FADCA18|nr:type II toxin-antitoxin system antitoxin SocA domain-containing protein [Roseburia faecis]
MEPCEAWKFGPVFPSVYEKYREFGKQGIKLNLSKDYISELLSKEEKTVTDFVMNIFGIYNAWFLKDLTHLEEPWIVARKGLAEDDASRNQMDEEIISNYFAKMNQMYDLKTAVGVEVYINHMKKEM